MAVRSIAASEVEVGVEVVGGSEVGVAEEGVGDVGVADRMLLSPQPRSLMLNWIRTKM